MPSSPAAQHHHHHDHHHIDESDNDDFSNANENSNLSEINPHVLSTPATLLRQAAAQMSAATTNFSQNSSSSSSSSYVNNNNNANAGSNSHNNSASIGGNNSGTNQNSSRDSSASRKFRHQNFSKNIYIGTKNAERWDNLRNLFQFKNDVEFVSFLLTVAENEARRKENGFKLLKFNNKTTSCDKDESPLESFIKQSRLQTSNSSCDNQQQQQHRQGQQQQLLIHQQQQQQQQQISKKVKRVQFQDDVNIINDSKAQESSVVKNLSASNNENNAQDHSISSTIDGSSVTSEESNNTTEILDCRIAEKIKHEIEEKKKLFENGRKNNNGSSGRIRYDDAPTPPPPISSSLMDKQAINEADIDDEDEEEEDIINDGESDDELDENNAAATNEDDEMMMNDENNQTPLRPSLLSKHRFYESIRKAPTMLDVKLSETTTSLVGNNDSATVNQDKSVFDFKDEDEDDDCEGRLEINSDFMVRDRKMSTKKVYKSRHCLACNSKHGKETCPIKAPLSSIPNQIDFAEWIQEHPVVEPPAPPYADKDAPLEDDKMFYEESIKSEQETGELDELEDEGEEEDELDENKLMDLNADHIDEYTFADASLPSEFDFMPSLAYAECKKSVFTKMMIPKYTQLGPLVGVVTPESEISDDSTMCFFFEIHDAILLKSTYFNLENKQKSNWIRYLQPAKARDQRNLTLVKVEDKIFFVSCVDISPGCELLYWSDDVNSAWCKKKMDKMNCGGCNIRFEHPLHYRTHCSVFHDPGFSLTIRKYHCKVCGVPVLGKENIMKHAEKLHDGKGAYQCQYCRKFFLRLNYLEMHRTYGCSMNPKRTRPLCDFCGKKFCQPQKLKIHIKRMHSDMAEVLRDFQCKLCSKLLGSRAALQRHSKEVHSRNSAVVSCPRCQKLFQNRSNLKIHMLTHSGVRPFKCNETECAAAFTTKQCLQFHYKKVHGYTQEQMPKIERSVAYTFDAYSGDYPVDHINDIPEQIPRRQRKSTSSESSAAKSASSSSHHHRDKDLAKEKNNFLSSISDLCKGENNLELLSSKITSILSSNLKDMNKKLSASGGETSSNIGMADDDDEGDEYQHEEDDGNHHQYCDNMNESELIETKLMVTQNMRNLLQKHQQRGLVDDSLTADSISGHDNNTNDMEHDDELEDERESFKAPINRRGGGGGLLDNTQLALTSNPRLKDFLLQANQNLVMSKGSKKWISDAVQMNGSSMDESEAAMAQANRDFLAKLISSKLHKGRSIDEEDEDSPEMSVESQHNLHHHHHHHHHHQSQHEHQQHEQHQQDQENDQFNESFNQSTMAQNSGGGGGAGMMEIQSQYQNNNGSNNVFNSHFNPLGGFYNANVNANHRSIPTSASMLVEAALSSVSSMMGNSDMSESGGNQQMTMDEGGEHQQDLPDEMTSQEYHHQSQQQHDMMDDGSMKMMKQNFPVHLPSISSFGSSVNTNLMRDNGGEIEVDAASSTPKPPSYPSEKESQHVGASYQTNDGCSPARTMTPDQHNASYNGNSYRNPQVVAQIQQTSPGHLTVRPIYSSEHELVASPASTPSLPRYDFSSESYRRREKGISSQNIHTIQQQQHPSQQQQQQQPSSQITHMSSDEENSIVIAENLSVSQQQQQQVVNDKIKINSQVDLLYANSSLQNPSNHQITRETLNEMRLKYNQEQNMVEVQEFSRNSAVVNDNVVSVVGNGGSSYQGLDMSSRSSIGYHSHNFPAAGSNLSFNRYQHHIYDILTDREQATAAAAAQHQSQQDHHPFQLHHQPQQQQQQIQHLIQDHISQQQQQQQHQQEQDADQLQSGVDLSRTSNYIVPSPPPHLQYSHTHSEMLRMASLDLSSAGSGVAVAAAAANIVSTNNPHHVRHHSSFLSHTANRELTDHHRFLSAADQRLLVDPTTHLLIEQNNRLLSSENNRILDQSRLLTEGPTNRHVVSPRGFGAYHHHPHHSHHTQMKYHQGPPAPNQQQNYHPFSATYY